jgi:hypothetical protein
MPTPARLASAPMPMDSIVEPRFCCGHPKLWTQVQSQESAPHILPPWLSDMSGVLPTLAELWR